ncbi:hypothetical protein Ancab_021622 [Ancistrocladus abbreviatus]
MQEKKYTKSCAEEVAQSLNLPVDQIRKCVGDPAADVENEVLKNKQDKQDTFRGRVCECQFCTVFSSKAMAINLAKLWDLGDVRSTMVVAGRTLRGEKLSQLARSDSELTGCRCPEGFRGDGYNCEDIDECKEHTACQCDGCSCKNTWAGYDCKCGGNHLYIKEQDTCIEKSSSKFARSISILVLAIVAAVGVAGGYVFYKYRLRTDGLYIECDDRSFKNLALSTAAERCFICNKASVLSTIALVMWDSCSSIQLHCFHDHGD